MFLNVYFSYCYINAIYMTFTCHRKLCRYTWDTSNVFNTSAYRFESSICIIVLWCNIFPEPTWPVSDFWLIHGHTAVAVIDAFYNVGLSRHISWSIQVPTRSCRFLVHFIKLSYLQTSGPTWKSMYSYQLSVSPNLKDMIGTNGQLPAWPVSIVSVSVFPPHLHLVFPVSVKWLK